MRLKNEMRSVVRDVAVVVVGSVIAKREESIVRFVRNLAREAQKLVSEESDEDGTA